MIVLEEHIEVEKIIKNQLKGVVGVFTREEISSKAWIHKGMNDYEWLFEWILILMRFRLKGNDFISIIWRIFFFQMTQIGCSQWIWKQLSWNMSEMLSNGRHYNKSQLNQVWYDVYYFWNWHFLNWKLSDWQEWTLRNQFGPNFQDQ